MSKEEKLPPKPKNQIPVDPDCGFGRTGQDRLTIMAAWPQAQSELWITEDFVIHTTQKMPNRWRRFWYWALLGWRWEDK